MGEPRSFTVRKTHKRWYKPLSTVKVLVFVTLRPGGMNTLDIASSVVALQKQLYRTRQNELILVHPTNDVLLLLQKIRSTELHTGIYPVIQQNQITDIVIVGIIHHAPGESWMIGCREPGNIRKTSQIPS